MAGTAAGLVVSAAEIPNIEHRRRPTPELVKLLEDVRFGDRGLRYRRRNLAATLDSFTDASYHSLHVDGQLRGGYVLVPGAATLAGAGVAAYYRALLAIDADFRGRGYGSRLVEAAFDAVADRHSGPALAWGLIERHNRASRRVLEAAGAAPVGTVDTFLVYRQWPRPDPDVRRLDGQALDTYVEALAAAGSGKGFAVRAPARLPAYGLFVDGVPVAAARIGRTVLDLGPGNAAARLLHRYAYSRFAALGRRYNRRAFTYLTIHDPLVPAQRADLWERYLSAVLAETGTHMASFTLDPSSDTYTQLDETGLFGRFAESTRQELLVYARTWNLDDDACRPLHDGPFEGGPVM